ncbi:hypothetical protein [Nocardia gamkensis]|uniref:hypothetical protein n=1 Tax=Nocardia gamkensis TaxID=352869 RepID=UPI0037CC19FD
MGDFSWYPMRSGSFGPACSAHQLAPDQPGPQVLDDLPETLGLVDQVVGEMRHFDQLDSPTKAV